MNEDAAKTGRNFEPGRLALARFVGIFALLLIGFYIAALLPFGDKAFYNYLVANAKLTNVVLRFLGQNTRVLGVVIRSDQYAIAVRRGCDALEPAWFFCAAVIAFPVPWRRKFAALTLGTATILSLNIVRIASLYFIGLSAPGFFSLAHLDLWPAAFMIVILFLWTLWIRTALGQVKFSKL